MTERVGGRRGGRVGTPAPVAGRPVRTVRGYGRQGAQGRCGETTP